MPTTEDKIIRFFHRKVSAQEDGLKTMVVWCIGKGDRVPVEVILVMNLKNSRQYRDEKYMFSEFRDGKINSGGKYLDTQHANDFSHRCTWQ